MNNSKNIKFQIVALIAVFAGSRDPFYKDVYTFIHPEADSNGTVNEKAVEVEALESAETFWNAAEGALMQASMCALPELDKLELEMDIFGFRKRIKYTHICFSDKSFQTWTHEFELLMKEEETKVTEELAEILKGVIKEIYAKTLHC